MSQPADERPPKAPRPCPICRKMSVAAYHPFCSRRCADVDLSRWFSEVYVAPVAPSEEDEEAPPLAPRDEDGRES